MVSSAPYASRKRDAVRTAVGRAPGGTSRRELALRPEVMRHCEGVGARKEGHGAQPEREAAAAQERVEEEVEKAAKQQQWLDGGRERAQDRGRGASNAQEGGWWLT